MIDPKKQAEFDQCSQLMVETFPPLWWAMFRALLKEGFTEPQAMDLLKTFIASITTPPK